jgi:hypothetical protein
MIEEDHSTAIDIEKPTIGPRNYGSIVKDYHFIPRNITRYQPETEGVGFFRNQSCAFYMDAAKFADIVDFWNLRALGRSVIPIPKQFVDVPEYIALIRNYVRDWYRVNPHSPEDTYGTTVIRSFASTMPFISDLPPSGRLRAAMRERQRSLTRRQRRPYRTSRLPSR